jgi:hypothetical protein
VIHPLKGQIQHIDELKDFGHDVITSMTNIEHDVELKDFGHEK